MTSTGVEQQVLPTQEAAPEITGEQTVTVEGIKMVLDTYREELTAVAEKDKRAMGFNHEVHDEHSRLTAVTNELLDQMLIIDPKLGVTKKEALAVKVRKDETAAPRQKGLFER